MKLIWIKIIEDLFYIALLTWVIYFILEMMIEGLISNYFDLNLLLIAVIGLGTLNVFLKSKNEENVE